MSDTHVTINVGEIPVRIPRSPSPSVQSTHSACENDTTLLEHKPAGPIPASLMIRPAVPSTRSIEQFAKYGRVNPIDEPEDGTGSPNPQSKDDTNNPIPKSGSQPEPAGADTIQPAPGADSYTLSARLQHAVLPLINNQLVPGMHQHTVHRLGDSVAPGLHVATIATAGANMPQSITLQFRLKRSDEMYTITKLIIDVAQTPGVTLQTIDASNAEELLTVLPDDSHLPQGVEYWGRIPKDYHVEWENYAAEHDTTMDQLSRAQRVEARTQCVQVVRGTIPKSAVVFEPYHSFRQNESKHSSDIRQAATRVRQFVEDLLRDEAPDEFNLTMIFTQEDRVWHAMQDTTINRHPYQQILSNARDGDETDLDFRNIHLPNEARPLKPHPASFAFLHNVHHTVSLMLPAMDEYAYDEFKAEACTKQTFGAVVLPVPGHVWAADDKNYGIEPDNQPLSYLVAIPLKGTANYLPQPGEAVAVAFGATMQLREVPSNFSLTHEQVESLSQRIADELNSAISRAENALDNHRQHVRKQKPGDDSYQNEVDEYKLYDRHLEASYESRLAQFINLLRDEGEIETTWKKRLEGEAVTVGCQLGLQTDESPESQLKRIREWVVQNGIVTRAEEAPVDVWHGKRLQHMAGMVQPVAVFHVRTPRQPNWPPSHAAPPITPQFRLVDTDLGDNLGDYFDHAIQYQIFNDVTVYFMPDPTHANQECRAIHGLNNVKVGSDAQQCWQWMASFASALQPELVNFFDRFPALARFIEKKEVTGEHKDALHTLNRVPGGMVFLTGGPGSGKSRFCRIIARAAVDVRSNMSYDPPKSLTDQALQELQDQLGQQQGDGVFDVGDIVRPNETVKFREVIKFERRGDVAVDQPQNQSKVLWVAPQNAQVDDAARRLAADCPGRCVLRSYTWSRELAHLLLPANEEPQPITPKGSNNRISLYVDNCRLAANRQTNPSLNPQSVSQYARQLAQANPDKYSTVHRAWAARATNSTDWILNKPIFIGAARELLSEAYTTADIVVTTPVALALITDHLPSQWIPSLIIADEAGRMSEPTALIPKAAFPTACLVFAGDIDQFSPFCAVDSDPRYNAFSPEQRMTSLLERAISQGAPTITLRQNHRSVAKAHEMAKRHIYRERMELVRRADSKYEYLRGWLAEHLGSGQQTQMLHIAKAKEARAGTSYVNSVHAKYIADLVVFMQKALHRDAPAFAKIDQILVITHYSVQKHAILAALSGVPEEVSQIVDVRTTDDSPSHEADVVISDWVRTFWPGFTGGEKRVSVATTRARYFTLILAHKDPLDEDKLLRDLLHFCTDRGVSHNVEQQPPLTRCGTVDLDAQVGPSWDMPSHQPSEQTRQSNEQNSQSQLTRQQPKRQPGADGQKKLKVRSAKRQPLSVANIRALRATTQASAPATTNDTPHGATTGTVDGWDNTNSAPHGVNTSTVEGWEAANTTGAWNDLLNNSDHVKTDSDMDADTHGGVQW